MALKASPCRQSIEISEPIHVDAARRAVVRAASALGGDEQWLGRLTVVVQELARNLVNHAGQGTLLFSADEQGIELLAVDRGPGMTDVARCLADNYSTAGTMGAGLGAIRRMSDGFDIYSQPGGGTLVRARLALGAQVPEPLISGAVSTPHPAEEVCGDGWAVKGSRVMVCDGLGHGHAAHAASSRAYELFLDHDPAVPLPELMQRTHRVLSSTRGGAMAFAEIQADRGQVLFCGVGNIAGTLLADRSRSMVSANGTVGYKVGRIQTFNYPWDSATVLVMASDGIGSKWSLDKYPGILASTRRSSPG